MSFLIDSLIKDIVSITYRDILRRQLVTPFIVFAAFLISFVTFRAAAYFFPTFNIVLGKYHIHHFYYGIALLIISNWVALISNRQRPIHLAAALSGIGLGTIADEIGLLLTCTSPLVFDCSYHARITIDLFIVMVAMFLSILYFIPAGKRLVKNARALVLRLRRKKALFLQE